MQLEITRYSNLINADFEKILLKKEPVAKETMASLFESCKEEIVTQIISQFGLSQIYDTFKDGGNVTTMHNAKKSIYSDKETKEQFEKRYNQNVRKEIYEKGFPKKRKEILSKNQSRVTIQERHFPKMEPHI